MHRAGTKKKVFLPIKRGRERKEEGKGGRGGRGRKEWNGQGTSPPKPETSWPRSHLSGYRVKLPHPSPYSRVGTCIKQGQKKGGEKEKGRKNGGREGRGDGAGVKEWDGRGTSLK
ncbi:hypothetical protein AMTR_s00041p00107850 [Amborella trichopoda]|uniref:Uncharacterized protein n=1 Tax=Amborella trichopoda TaxID=13333 RepID=W1PYZ2_AMBTC|nr:hypothetical protein AMTR_s00041p00107850 [Amborella trichopoda]